MVALAHLHLIFLCLFIIILLSPFSNDKHFDDTINIKTVEVDSLQYNKIIASTIAKTTLSNLINLMYDTIQYTTWLHHCREAQILKKTSVTSGYYAFIYESQKFLFVRPKDRLLIGYVTLEQDPGSKAVVIKTKDVGKDGLDIYEELLQYHDVVRAKFFDCTFRFIPLRNREIQVEYEIYIDPDVDSILSGFVEGYVKGIGQKTLENLLKIVNSEKYSKKSPVIEDTI